MSLRVQQCDRFRRRKSIAALGVVVALAIVLLVPFAPQSALRTSREVVPSPGVVSHGEHAHQRTAFESARRSVQQGIRGAQRDRCRHHRRRLQLIALALSISGPARPRLHRWQKLCHLRCGPSPANRCVAEVAGVLGGGVLRSSQASGRPTQRCAPECPQNQPLVQKFVATDRRVVARSAPPLRASGQSVGAWHGWFACLHRCSYWPG